MSIFSPASRRRALDETRPALDADGRYVDRKLEAALSEQLTKSFWTTTPGETDAYPPEKLRSRMTREQWESLSPGMRREITRQFTPPATPPEPPAPPPSATLNEHERAMVRVEAKQRL